MSEPGAPCPPGLTHDNIIILIMMCVIVLTLAHSVIHSSLHKESLQQGVWSTKTVPI